MKRSFDRRWARNIGVLLVEDEVGEIGDVEVRC